MSLKTSHYNNRKYNNSNNNNYNKLYFTSKPKRSSSQHFTINFTNFESDFSLEQGWLEALNLKEEDTVHIPWMNEMSDHQRSLLEKKETQHQLNTALCPGKDKGIIFKNSMAHW